MLRIRANGIAYCAIFLIVCVSTVPSARAQDAIAQWDFDDTLEATTDHDDLLEEIVPPAFEALVDFLELEIGGEEAQVAFFTQGTAFRLSHGFAPNGSGPGGAVPQYVNQYTLILDVLYPENGGELDPDGLLGTDGWQCLYQTSEGNANDADWCVQPDASGSGIGISNNYGGLVADDAWHRLALVVDLSDGAGTYTSYINGEQVQQNTDLGFDGRFAVGATIILFADDNGETAGGFVNSVQLRDRALSAGEIAALGGPTADGIPLPDVGDPRSCDFRQFAVAFDAATGGVDCSWQLLAGDQGFRVERDGVSISGDLSATTDSFTDAAPPEGAADVVYTLQPLQGGVVERECPFVSIATFSCPEGIACCADQETGSVEIAWTAAANLGETDYTVRRDGGTVATLPAGTSSYTDTAPGVGRHTYEVVANAGAACVDPLTCTTVVTGVVIESGGACGGIIAQYDFEGDLSSSYGGADLVPLVSPPLVPDVDLPEVIFDEAEINGETAQIAEYGRGTYFHLFTGFGANAGGIYTNRFTLIMDVLFPAGALDESGWAPLYQTNTNNANDGDWFVRGSDRGIGISGSYGGMVEDDTWYRLALVLDLVEGTYTSYVDGAQVQQNTGEGLDGRFSLYTTDDGPLEGILLFADDSAENSRGLVNSVQIRDVAMSAAELAGMGGASAEGIPSEPDFICPTELTCCVDQSTSTASLGWTAGVRLGGLEILRDGERIATVSGDASSYEDTGAPAGDHVYEVRVADGESCAALPLRCPVSIVPDAFFFEGFDCGANDADLLAAGWEINEVNNPLEDQTWSTTNRFAHPNPPSRDGSPTAGGFIISEYEPGNAGDVEGSGVSHDLVTPAFSTSGASTVWLHADAVVQLNNNGTAVFDVDVSTDGGASWNNIFRRIAPARSLPPLPDLDLENADGLFGRFDVDLSAVAANQTSVRLRFRHFEPTDDWWIALDNILVDDRAGTGGSLEVLALEDFGDGVIPPDWDVTSGPDSDLFRSWGVDDLCGISLLNTLGSFPDASDGRQLHQFDEFFALVDPLCSLARQDEYLGTPPLDCSALDRIFLHFRSSILTDANALAEVLLSLDGGETYEAEPVFSYNRGALLDPGEEPLTNAFVLEVPRAAREADVVFAFHYRTLGDAPPAVWWAIDDVRVSGEGGGVPVFRRGDADAVGAINLTDGVFLLNFLFLGGPAPPCMDAADANDDGQLNITTGVYVFNWLFLGGPLPPAPGPTNCGPDPSGDDLGCTSYDNC